MSAPPVSSRTAAIIAGAAVAASGLIGAWVGPRPGRPETRAWYRRLAKPPETPQAPVFGLVWPVLESMHAVSGYRLLRAPRGPRRTAALALWGLNTALIGGWSALFFGAKRLNASAVTAGAMLAAQAALVPQTARLDRKAAVLEAPLLGWLGFAAWLSARIARRNP